MIRGFAAHPLALRARGPLRFAPRFFARLRRARRAREWRPAEKKENPLPYRLAPPQEIFFDPRRRSPRVLTLRKQPRPGCPRPQEGPVFSRYDNRVSIGTGGVQQLPLRNDQPDAHVAAAHFEFPRQGAVALEQAVGVVFDFPSVLFHAQQAAGG